MNTEKNCIKKLTIKGFRGFIDERTIEFSWPNSELQKSGLTYLVGPNNSGKSTVIESLFLLCSSSAKDISEDKRTAEKGEVHIELETDGGVTRFLISTQGSTTQFGGSIKTRAVASFPCDKVKKPPR